MIEQDICDQIGLIEFNHGKVNAMDLEFCNQLVTSLDQFANSDCRAVVIGSKSAVFSAGIDLKRWLREGPDYVKPFMESLEKMFETVFRFPKPVVADISGAAIAGGCMAAAACDFRVISSTAKMGILESRLGVPLPMTAIEIMRHVTLPSVFRRLISIGATYVGPNAVNVGLADAVNDTNSSRSEAIQLAKELARLPHKAFVLTKQQRIQPVMRIIRENQKLLGKDYFDIWQSPETRTAIQQYVDQRLS